ncbi:hypothetical protein CYMTET_22327 [Cymbomonas tetramitiformis]|uniref:Transmembrane protein n=1 Tax=Cymbomonas tetramitiformis TaxID=36881 RepID=A0AAE0L213_9CHLO|nr:hypothetical protein CYMTET_22327 [Cymbomonas tetramitiformis]
MTRQGERYWCDQVASQTLSLYDEVAVPDMYQRFVEFLSPVSLSMLDWFSIPCVLHHLYGKDADAEAGGFVWTFIFSVALPIALLVPVLILLRGRRIRHHAAKIEVLNRNSFRVSVGGGPSTFGKRNAIFSPGGSKIVKRESSNPLQNAFCLPEETASTAEERGSATEEGSSALTSATFCPKEERGSATEEEQC